MTLIETKLTAARAISSQDQTVASEIPDGHARLRLAVGSLCGTDMHYFADFANAGFQLCNPVTLGHEACAWVTDPNGSDLKAGQLVALNPIMNCGVCEACKRGEVNLCTAKKFPGSATTVPHLDGFFREVIDHPVRCCRPVADHVDPRHLTFAEPLACALHSLNKGGVSAGQKVLVTGCGPMGLLAIAGAAARGAEVTALDLRPKAVDVALRAGAKTGLVVGEFDPADLTKQFDVVIEASGALPAFNTALDAARQKGRVSILSNVHLRAAEVTLNLIMLKELEVVGSFQFNSEFEQAVQLIEAGSIDFDVLTAGSFPLEETAKALELMTSGKAYGKIIILGQVNKDPGGATQTHRP
ncbi:MULTISPECIES: zinc-binding dehydrogenase [unclassified Ruegeria]|uniref:zinc-binding dehydrogenase n=1 Tax=unclassified Ruegeria TaxID=2625375 RepID=UPI001488E092|nr:MULTISPECIES: alcohol dehydrogenase catalytic domain-containing protein [unclassified Ruegeria]